MRPRMVRGVRKFMISNPTAPRLTYVLFFLFFLKGLMGAYIGESRVIHDFYEGKS